MGSKPQSLSLCSSVNVGSPKAPRIPEWEAKGKGWSQKEAQGLTAGNQCPAPLLVSGGVTLIAQQAGTQASSYSLLFPAAPVALDFLRH